MVQLGEEDRRERPKWVSWCGLEKFLESDEQGSEFRVARHAYCVDHIIR